MLGVQLGVQHRKLAKNTARPKLAINGGNVKTVERRVSYWAVQGDRWCNVDGMINAALMKKWELAGWRVVTRVTYYNMPIFGGIEWVDETNEGFK